MSAVNEDLAASVRYWSEQHRLVQPLGRDVSQVCLAHVRVIAEPGGELVGLKPRWGSVRRAVAHERPRAADVPRPARSLRGGVRVNLEVQRLGQQRSRARGAIDVGQSESTKQCPIQCLHTRVGRLRVALSHRSKRA